MKNKYSKELRALARHYKTTPEKVLKEVDNAVMKLLIDKHNKSGAACIMDNNTIH